ncbi:MAG TPA: DNA-processing protein DprA [Candidatus Saccharimonadales bacterium]|nr:DNA-processing protein DprA [Candidatus Saccharimonadales bacterium]
MQKIYRIREFHLGKQGYPAKLAPLPDPPQQILVMGQPLGKLLSRPAVAIVGSRKVTAYGKAVTTKLAGELAERGVVIISGLAFGVDSIAHRAALEANGTTIAVLPSSLNAIYPSVHYQLAHQILEQGGALVTEYPDNTKPHKYHFVARNRIVSGLADGVLITEAADKSGTLHTANFALDQGKEVMAVPGNITSPLSLGTNQLIKTGATAVTNVSDILRALGLEAAESKKKAVAASAEEAAILDLLEDGAAETEVILAKSGLELAIFNQTLTMLEITGKINPVGSGQWMLA